MKLTGSPVMPRPFEPPHLHREDGVAQHQEGHEPQRDDIADEEHDQDGDGGQAIGDRVQQLAEPRDLVPAPGQHAVEEVRDPTEGQDQGRQAVLLRAPAPARRTAGSSAGGCR